MQNNREAYTISASSDNHAENHSRRAYTPFSAEASLSSRNIVIYDCGDDRTNFNEFFRDSIREYNERQTRADRKKDLDYLKALEDGREGYGSGDKKEKPFCHDVIQIGDHNTNGITDDSFDVDHWRDLKKQKKTKEAAAYVAAHLPQPGTKKYKIQQDLVEVLKEIAVEIRDNKDNKYSNILVHGLIIHFDEPNGTPHLDFRYTIFTDNEKTGLRKRVSMNKGLKRMGYVYTRDEPAIVKFREDIKSRIEQKMAQRGYGREVKGEHHKHLSTSAYELEKRAEAAERRQAEAENHISEIMQREQEANTLLDTARQVQAVLKQLIINVQDELKRQKLSDELEHVAIPQVQDKDNAAIKPEKGRKKTTLDGKAVLTPEDFLEKYSSAPDHEDNTLARVAMAIKESGMTPTGKKKEQVYSK